MNDKKTCTNDILEDYATSPVPEDKTIGGVRIGMINGGLAFAVPGLITGLEIGKGLGLEQSIYAFILGGFILSVLGYVTGLVGMYNRLASCMMMKFVFGRVGANILSLAFVLSLLGWYGVNIDVFSKVIQELIQDTCDYTATIWLLEIVIGVLITLTTILGFKLLEKLSSLLVPVLFLIVIYMLYQSMGYSANELNIPTETTNFTFGEAVSAVVGSFIVSVVLMPDFTRFSATKKGTFIASFLPFLFINNFVYIVAAIAGLAVVNNDVLQVMLALGLGGFAFVLLITSGWVTSVINLYSSALGLNAITRKWPEWKVIIFVGILGTFIASFNLLDNFTSFLFGLSTIFTPVAAIYVIDFFVIRKKQRYVVEELSAVSKVNVVALVAWAVGIVVSMLTNQGYFTLTTIEVCDSLLITAPVYYLLMKINPKFNTNPVH
ncbi:cytosine permease [Pseudocolwellia agarivorans]|uniref:cytosine permease n=1 Tax=Pseudocolwellia agarivorans TaxID=1911682 RepID=UPI0009847F3D|nr:cytosine permease [Pseudocolwellia agarivorans]